MSDWTKAEKTKNSRLPHEQGFPESPDSSYAIYQLKSGKENRGLRFAGLSELHEPVQKERYDLVYIGSLSKCEPINPMPFLESLYIEFNLFPPNDFRGHSLSVSDVIVLKQRGRVQAFYTDRIGFKPLPDFVPDPNPLRNAEMAMEDDFDMIDGIINNGPRQEKEPHPVLNPKEHSRRQPMCRSVPER